MSVSTLARTFVVVGVSCGGPQPHQACDSRVEVEFRLNDKPIRVSWTHPSSLETQNLYDCEPRGAPEHGLATAMMLELRAVLDRQGLVLESFALVDSTKGDGLTSAIQQGVTSAAVDLRTERGVMVVSKLGNRKRRVKQPLNTESLTRAERLEQLPVHYYCLDATNTGDAIIIKADLFRGLP